MKHKIMHIVGNRPQFIKLAPVSREIRKRGHREIIVHTGQHYDENMSDIFFREMDIPEPDENLHVSGGSHSEMVARIMLALESVVIKHNPRLVIIYGDTNSTLAAALVVRKLNIPIVHIEAGARAGMYSNPEEANRILADHASQLLCTADRAGLENLKAEGLEACSYFTGDVMYDAFCYYRDKADAESVMGKYGLKRKEYILMTWHREENTSGFDRMERILRLVESLKKPIICPMHPRTRNRLTEFGLMDRARRIHDFKIVQPTGYLEMTALSSNSAMIITDSGGLSKESYFAGVKCMLMLDLGVWSDLERIGWIKKMSQNEQDNINIVEQCFNARFEMRDAEKERFYGDGNAAGQVVDLIEKIFNGGKKHGKQRRID